MAEDELEVRKEDGAAYAAGFIAGFTYAAGFIAGFKGQPETDNPYSESSKRDFWLNGWKAGSRELGEQKNGSSSGVLTR